ncbi:hypothetical protein RFI_25863 [Reticulomyxa filosa]|uniref:Uncharacterized protein n=1 Tax=Reticulomyxa filosa TaxID=46433 RepID=X6MBX5_RETFI|nr:hypothetical protein RFI_25863 [Reticulomyxa filosa]|eukprot:ETO11513.1 hypothetical protein RFI_25863 [Reticulomyxa filosa]
MLKKVKKLRIMGGKKRAWNNKRKKKKRKRKKESKKVIEKNDEKEIIKKEEKNKEDNEKIDICNVNFLFFLIFESGYPALDNNVSKFFFVYLKKCIMISCDLML